MPRFLYPAIASGSSHFRYSTRPYRVVALKVGKLLIGLAIVLFLWALVAEAVTLMKGGCQEIGRLRGRFAEEDGA